MSTAVEIIRRKRDGEELSSDEIADFVTASAQGTWPDYQLSALLMAIYQQGMTPRETAELTRFMADSGERYSWDDIPGPKADKHSTGGVGDKTSLILAPLAAACGVIVPMMSGRGLGHSGGTLDKLESIPGFKVQLSRSQLRRSLRQIGVAMIGQTKRVAPADRKLYALRDVTATIECIPLITASILSKKLAEGIDALVMDVKFGRGAFMKSKANATKLAASIRKVGEANGLRTETVLSPMDHPLGQMVGNSLEVMESITTLRGQGPDDLTLISCDLAARMVFHSGRASTRKEAMQQVQTALDSGSGLEKFRQIIEHQGGDPRVVDDFRYLPQSPRTCTLRSPRRGILQGLHAEKIGIACMRLGAGRQRAEDRINPAVGVRILANRGDSVTEKDGILEIHYHSEETLDQARALFQEAIEITE